VSWSSQQLSIHGRFQYQEVHSILYNTAPSQKLHVDVRVSAKKVFPIHCGKEHSIGQKLIIVIIWSHRVGALKMREWKMQELKNQEWTAVVENAGVENAGADSRGGKCRSGKWRSWNVWKAVRTEKSILESVFILGSGCG